MVSHKYSMEFKPGSVDCKEKFLDLICREIRVMVIICCIMFMLSLVRTWRVFCYVRKQAALLLFSVANHMRSEWYRCAGTLKILPKLSSGRAAKILAKSGGWESNGKSHRSSITSWLYQILFVIVVLLTFIYNLLECCRVIIKTQWWLGQHDRKRVNTWCRHMHTTCVSFQWTCTSSRKVRIIS